MKFGLAAVLAAFFANFSTINGLDVLYIGNNLITSIPSMVKTLARQNGVTINNRMVTEDGATCEEHCSDHMSQILQSCPDVVVIQEQSSRMSFGIGDVYYMSLPYCQKIVDRIRAKCKPDPEFVFVQTWPHKNGDENNCEELPSGDIVGYPHMCNWTPTMDRIKETSQTQAYLATPAKVAPCGEALEMIKNIKKLYPRMYQADGILPKKDLAALCSYALAPQVIGKKLAWRGKKTKLGLKKGGKRYYNAAIAALASDQWTFDDPNATPPCDACINANA